MKPVIIFVFVLLTSCLMNQTHYLPLSPSLINENAQSTAKIDEIKLCRGALVQRHLLSIECSGRKIEVVRFQSSTIDTFDKAARFLVNRNAYSQYQILQSDENNYYVKFNGINNNPGAWIYV